MIFSPKIQKQKSHILHLDSFDKSLSHRSVIFAFLTQGTSEIEDFLVSEDTLATLEIAQMLGAKITFQTPSHFLITPPAQIPSSLTLQCRNSGTTMRLYAGLLSGKEGEFLFDGDASLRKRPMQRIRTPLEQMGASFSSSFAPFKLKGNKNLKSISYASPIASAQVKSAFILSALYADGQSCYQETSLSRDHSERFLQSLGAEIKRQKSTLLISPLQNLLPSYHIKIPNDPSSAIFFVVACLISQDLELQICNVLLNPTRIYALEFLKAMGAKITYQITRNESEEIGDIYVCHSDLTAVQWSSNIAWLIDEIPALSIACACAKGRSIITQAKELRYKESDRIVSIVSNLKALGIQANELEDGLEIIGGDFQDGEVKSFGDHRIAMSFAIVGLKRCIKIQDVQCINVSFPHFLDFLKLFVAIKE